MANLLGQKSKRHDFCKQFLDKTSLDVEGGEFDVLKTIDFNIVDISTFVIEHNGRPSELKRFRDLFNGLKFEDSRPMFQ